MLYWFIAVVERFSCGLHLMLHATNNCLKQERRVTFVGLVYQLIHSDNIFQHLYVQFLTDSMKTVKAFTGNI